MASQSQYYRHYEGYLDTKAAKADQEAAAASTPQLVQSWRLVAETYRWLAYRRRAFGKWQPRDETTAGGAPDLP
jgi:hypothetical protein